VPYQVDARIDDGADGVRRLVGAVIVHDDDAVDEAWQAAEHACDAFLLRVGGNDHEHRRVRLHGAASSLTASSEKARALGPRLGLVLTNGVSDELRAPLRRSAMIFRVVVALLLLGLCIVGFVRLRFPSDQTPQGAYLRVAKAVNRGAPEEFFAYLEDPAQHACYTIADYRKKSLERARGAYPKPEFDKLEKSYGAVARAPDGADVFALYARDEGWLSQLRRDLSGVERIEIVGERATVQTAKGSRYALRRRPNGIWGLTAFTPTLLDEAARAARDFSLVDKAASDYERARSRGVGP